MRLLILDEAAEDDLYILTAMGVLRGTIEWLPSCCVSASVAQEAGLLSSVRHG
jgi:hypothetical protein